MAPTEISVGLNKGHKVTKNNSKPKVVRRKGVSIFFILFYCIYLLVLFINPVSQDEYQHVGAGVGKQLIK